MRRLDVARILKILSLVVVIFGASMVAGSKRTREAEQCS